MIRRIRGNKPEERIVSVATDKPTKVNTDAPSEQPTSKQRSEAREKNAPAGRQTNVKVPEETGTSAKTTMKRGASAKPATSQVTREKTPPRDVIVPKKEPRFRRPVTTADSQANLKVGNQPAPKEETALEKEPISTRRSVSPPKKEPISTRRAVIPPKKGSTARKAVTRKKVESESESEERKLDVESERESDAESISASEAESGSGSESSDSEESENDLESESESKSRAKRVKDKKKEPISRPVRGKKVLSESEEEEESEDNRKVSSRLSLRKKGEEGKKYASNNVVQRIRLPVFDNRYKVINLPDRPDVKQYVTPQILSAKAREIKTIIEIDENRLTDKKTKRDDGYYYKREVINTYAANLGIPTNLGKPEKNRRIREKIHAYKLESD